ncbi:unnamed protein product [Symbiodinium pilosum]|uniref:Autophagy-related protein n=1 Tax=Symbiodinium pilosum TaxID=2952 RepID=A0A812X1V7_SYMPI|nr:unnamed protein product [Symbiodinium pilosum]
MDPSKMEKLRKRYPDHVPVICVNTKDSFEQQKLIVPNNTTGAAFIGTAREKCKWATPASKVSLCKGSKTVVEVPMAKTLEELDKEATEGVIYFKVESLRPAAEERKEAEIPNVQQFKMDGAAPKEQKAKATTSAGKDDSDPSEKARRIRKKHPDRVPVLINQAEGPGLPALDKKLLIPKTMTCADLRKILPRHIGCQHLDVDWQKVIFEMAGEPVEEHEKVSDVYERRVPPDDEGMMLFLELPTESIRELVSSSTRVSEETELQDTVEETPAVHAASFSPPSLEEVMDLERQLTASKRAFEEAKKAQKLATARLAEQEERAWAAEEKALKADRELTVRSQAHRNKEEALQSQITEAQEAQKTLQTRVMSSREEIEALRLHIDWLEETAQTAKHNAEQDADTIVELENQLKEAQAALAVEAKKNHASQEKISQMRNKLEEAAQLEVLAVEKTDLISQQRKDAEDTVRTLEESLRKMSSRLEEVEQEKADLLRDAEKKDKTDEAVKKLKDTVIILRNSLSSKEEEITTKGAQVVETMACLKAVEQENRRLQAELEAAATEKIKLQQASMSAREEVEMLKAEMQKKDAEEDFIKLGWNSEGEVEEVTEDFGFQKVDSAC